MKKYKIYIVWDTDENKIVLNEQNKLEHAQQFKEWFLRTHKNFTEDNIKIEKIEIKDLKNWNKEKLIMRNKLEIWEDRLWTIYFTVLGMGIIMIITYWLCGAF